MTSVLSCRDSVAHLRQQVRQCHSDLDESASAWLDEPPASALSLYLHALCLEDIAVQSVLREDAPLFTSFWPGLSRPADLAALGQYATAVYASTDAFLRELPPDGLERVVDLRELGLGRRTVGWVTRRLVVQELGHISSEIVRGRRRDPRGAAATTAVV